MSDAVIDLNEFLERVQDDKELLVELLDIFQSDFSEKRKMLTDMLAQEDFEQIKGIAHSLKGASGNISAKQIRESFFKLEEMAKSGDLSSVAELLQLLDTQFEELIAETNKIKEDFAK